MATHEFKFYPPFSSGSIWSTIKQVFNKNTRPQNFVTLSESGFKLTLPAVQEKSILVSFADISNIYVTAILYSSDKGYKAFYACYFIELKQALKQLQSYYAQTDYGLIPFVVTPKDFSSYIGVSDLLGFYINPGDEGPQDDLRPFFTRHGFDVKRLRPVMKVASAQEYNSLLAEYMDESAEQEYRLP